MLQLECSELILNHAWIDNQKTGSSDGRTFTVEDPADGTVLATLPDCGPVEAEAAVGAAQRAFCTCALCWRKTWFLLPASAPQQWSIRG
jgi:succinate-semialdehyde dehydrogenase/glutarate-semialdehyde dehydrogenase